MSKLISIQNLTYEIPYTGAILENINLEIGPGEFLGVLGHNGAGKTTLLDLIMGFKSTGKGEISILGEDPYKRDRQHKDKIAFLSQDITLKGDISIEKFLNFHSQFYPRYSRSEEEILLKVFELDQRKLIGSLSTGQQKKVQFVAGLASMPEIIIADEVTAVLDPIGRRALFKELVRFKDTHQCSIVLATNIAEDLIGLAERIVFLKDKALIEICPDQIMDFFETKSAA